MTDLRLGLTAFKGLLFGKLRLAARLGLDQPCGHFHVLVLQDQLVQHFRAQARHQRAFQFALKIAAHFAAKLRGIAALDAEGLDECGVDFRQMRLGHTHDLDFDACILAGERGIAPVRWIAEFDLDRVIGAGSNQLCFDLAVEHAGTKHGGGAFHTFVRFAHAIGMGDGFHHGQIAGLGRAFHRLPGAALQTEGLDHLFDIGFLDLRYRAHDLQAGDVDWAELGNDLERRHITQLTFLGRPSLDFGLPGGAQVFVAHGFVEGVAHQIAKYLIAHLRAIALLDDSRWHLARPETLDARGAGDFAQALARNRIQTLGRQTDRQAALQTTCIFNRHLHDDSCMMTAAGDDARIASSGRQLAKGLMRPMHDEIMVRKKRLELSRVTPLEPKSSASTNSATLACMVRQLRWWAVKDSNLRPID